MENRLALALTLSLVILIGFQVLAPRPPEPATPATSGQAPESAAPAPGVAPAPPQTPAGAVANDVASTPSAAAEPSDPGAVVDVSTDMFRAEFSSRGGRLRHLELAKYRATADAGSGPHDLVLNNGLGPLALVWIAPSGTVVDDRSVLYDVQTTGASVAPGGTATVTMRGKTAGGASIKKTVVIHAGSYLLDYDVETEALGETPLAVGWSRSLEEHASRRDTDGPVVFADGKIHAFNAASLKEPTVTQGQVSWAGYAEHYFLAALVPEQRQPLKMVASLAEGAGHAMLWTMAPATSLHYQLYLGPKSLQELDKLGHDLGGAIDLGWFWFVARPLLWALLLIERAVGNYGIAIILLTVATRIVLYPINAKQMAAMKGMQKIQPEIQKIQERYKDDREKLNQEMMELYRRHKVNPLAGCLPMFLQLPVFIGLYNVLLQAIEIRQAPFFGWIVDLSQPDRLGQLPIPFVTPPGIPVMTLLMGASMILQQRMTPSTADPAQQRMMMLMPVVFTVMFVNFPAGLVLYWLSNNILSIAQQALANRSQS